MRGYLVGVFGTRQDLKTAFENSVGKKSETEGIIVYHRSESGVKYSFLDDANYPEKIQGYASIASICDYAYYIFPNDGKLTQGDGELAVLIDSFGIAGSIQVIDGEADAVRDVAKSAFKGLSLSSFPLDSRSSQSSQLDLQSVKETQGLPSGSLVYIDRVFNVKGVGLVVLGFVLSGKISVHDKLRLVPGQEGKLAEVKGIQISDEDYDSTERGIRVGLSLKGVELKDLQKVSWLDDGSFNLSNKISFDFNQSKYYKQPTSGRDLHIQCIGKTIVSKIGEGKAPSQRTAELPFEIPTWAGMPLAILDLNAKPLRVAGGGVLVSG